MRFSRYAALSIPLFLLAALAVWEFSRPILAPEGRPVPVGWHRVADGEHGFELAYPSQFYAHRTTDPFHFLPDVRASLYTDAASYRPANYAQDAWLVVSHGRPEGHCFAPLEDGAAFMGRLTIGGVEWRVASSAKAAAGNRYETTVYRTPRGAACLEIATTLHWASDFTGLDEEAARRSREETRALLRRTVEAFRFTD